jgi:hypothetical protein
MILNKARVNDMQMRNLNDLKERLNPGQQKIFEQVLEEFGWSGESPLQLIKDQITPLTCVLTLKNKLTLDAGDALDAINSLIILCFSKPLLARDNLEILKKLSKEEREGIFSVGCVESVGTQGWTILDFAVRSMDPELIQFLVGQGVNAKNREPLLEQALCGLHKPQLLNPVINILCRKVADDKQSIDHLNSYRQTPLCAFCEKLSQIDIKPEGIPHYQKVLNTLIGYGAKIDVPDENGMTPYSFIHQVMKPGPAKAAFLDVLQTAQKAQQADKSQVKEAKETPVDKRVSELETRVTQLEKERAEDKKQMAEMYQMIQQLQEQVRMNQSARVVSQLTAVQSPSQGVTQQPAANASAVESPKKGKP